VTHSGGDKINTANERDRIVTALTRQIGVKEKEKKA